MKHELDTDVLIIGAGPSGAVAACLLRQLGHRVTIIEKTTFPRFVIGESLLPQCLITLEKAGCLEAINKAGFQKKIGATFQHRGNYEKIVFENKFTAGPSHAFHVERAQFDQILADCAAQAGTNVIYSSTVKQVHAEFNQSHVVYEDSAGNSKKMTAKFILDASGYGRVLPRLLGIDKPSSLDPKASLFTHINDGIIEGEHSRLETLITTHPVHRDVWFWLISFSHGRSSVGVVGNPEFLASYQAQGIAGLQDVINEDPVLSHLLRNAKYDTQPYQLNAYSGSVSQFYGDGFAVLGNAGEFLDPIFSSGVTVAIQSSQLAVNAVDAMFKGQTVDWQADFVDPLLVGIETFKTFVNHWYSGGFQDVIYSRSPANNIKTKIASILAGYAWDETNPYVSDPEQRLNTLIQICQQ